MATIYLQLLLSPIIGADSRSSPPLNALLDARKLWCALGYPRAREDDILFPRHTVWIIGFASAIAAALIGMFFWMARQSHEIVVADTYTSSSNLALSVEKFVARTTETIDLSLQSVVDDIAAGRAKTTRRARALLAERVKGSPQLSRLVVVRPDGRVRFSSDRSAPPSIDVSKSAFFRLAREREGIHVVLDPDASGSGSQIVVSRRFSRKDGSFGGVVAATFDRDYIQRFLFIFDIGKRGVISVATIDGTLLVGWPYREDDIGKNLGSSLLFKTWLPAASAAVIPLRFDADGLWRIVGYRRVEKLPLVVQVALSKDDALANWRRITLIQATACAVILALLGWTAFLFDRELRARALAHERLGETVSELEEARQAAEESSRVKSNFLANMSHELRTPLNAIIGFSELIRDAQIGPVAVRYRDYARDIHTSGAHLLSLINDVLDLSKVEAGQLELREEPVDLSQVMNECSKMIADRVSTAALEFAIECPPELPPLVADELRLKQIVLNLLSNAVKFTPAGGRVVLSASMVEDGDIAISVSDTGIGMEPTEIFIALEPFRQLEGAFNRRFEGTGLGLPLVRRLAELHGGTLTITSAKGRGTVAIVRLPWRRIRRVPDQTRLATLHIVGADAQPRRRRRQSTS